MADVLYSFDDRLQEHGEFILATRQIVFGADFGDDDGKTAGTVYEFVANEETAEKFRQAMAEFIRIARKVDKVGLPKVPGNSERVTTLQRQRQQLVDKLVPDGLNAAPPSTVIAAEDVPDGFWQTRTGVGKYSDEGKMMIQLRADIKEWAVGEGLIKENELGGRGQRIPSHVGIAYGQAHPDRIPRAD